MGSWAVTDFTQEDYNFDRWEGIDFEGAKTMATMSAIQPGSYGFPINLKKRYDNYIGGEWVTPLSGKYFENVTPVTGLVICEIAGSNAQMLTGRSMQRMRRRRCGGRLRRRSADGFSRRLRS